MTSPSAVIFDCDGVLVDSEPHSVAAWVVVLEALGHPAGAAEVEACTGLGFEPTWRALSQTAPLPEPPEVWEQLITALEARFVDPGLERFPDAASLLEHCLEQGVPVAVVSASPRQRLDLCLRYGGFVDAFEVTVSGDDVADGKPAPDAYLAAAAALGVEPAVCVAIEDSPTGVASAQGAGMRVVAVVRDEALRPGLTATGAAVVDQLTTEVIGP